MFLRLKELEPLYDEVFGNFLDGLLRREHLSKFFRSDKQRRALIKTLRENISRSFEEDKEVLHERYMQIAEYHNNRRGVPFIDFMEALNFLMGEFYKILLRENKLLNYYEVITTFFEEVKQFSAEGYLMALSREVRELYEWDTKSFKPLDNYRGFINDALNAIKSKDIDSMMKQINPYTGNVAKWISSPEAKMMSPDEDTLKGIEDLHIQVHSLLESIMFYMQKGLYIQAYGLLKTFTNTSLLFLRKLDGIQASFNERKEKLFFEAIKNPDERDFIFFIEIENLPLLADIHGYEFKVATLKRLLDVVHSNAEEKYLLCLTGKNDEIMGFIKDTSQEEIGGFLNLIIENAQGRNEEESPKLKTIAMSAFEVFRQGQCLPDTFEKIMASLKDKAKVKEVYIANEDDVVGLKELIKSDAQKRRYAKDIFKEDRLEVFFQPVVGLRTGKVYDIEALVRLKEDNRYIPAFLFIDNLYRQNLIAELDMRVLEKVIGYAKQIKCIAKKVFINVSPLSLKSFEFRKSIERAITKLKEEEVTPYFELTEQAVLEHLDLVKYLNSHYGIRFAIDDFGTGYSSLKTIADLSEIEAVSYLKIDGSLTKGLPHSEEVYKIVKSTAYMAKSLGLKTVAEFVENEGLVGILKELDIDYGQGFHFSPPLHIDALMQKYQQ